MDQIGVLEQTSHSQLSQGQLPCSWAGLSLGLEHFLHKAKPTSSSLCRQPVLCGAGLRGSEGRRALAEPGRGRGGGQEIPQRLVADPVRRLSQSPGSPRERLTCCRCCLLLPTVWGAQEPPDLNVLGWGWIPCPHTPCTAQNCSPKCCALSPWPELLEAFSQCSFHPCPQVQWLHWLHSLPVPPALQEPSPQAPDHHELRPQHLHPQPLLPPAPGGGCGSAQAAAWPFL